MSLEQVARKLEMRKQSIAAIETGIAGSSVERLQEVANAIGADITVEVHDRTAQAVDPLAKLHAAVGKLDPVERDRLFRVAEVLATHRKSELVGEMIDAMAHSVGITPRETVPGLDDEEGVREPGAAFGKERG